MCYNLNIIIKTNWGEGMKKLVVNQEQCIKCHKCEEVCSMAFFKANDKDKSCIKIDEACDKPVNVCNQCGECLDVCSEEALKRTKNGVILLNKKLCVGCFMCVGFCSPLAMRMHEDHIEPFKCIACGLCVKECPTGALSIEE